MRSKFATASLAFGLLGAVPVESDARAAEARTAAVASFIHDTTQAMAQ
jgi:hypothetical protein